MTSLLVWCAGVCLRSVELGQMFDYGIDSAYVRNELHRIGWKYAPCKGWLCPACAGDFERELRARFPMAPCQGGRDEG